MEEGWTPIYPYSNHRYPRHGISSKTAVRKKWKPKREAPIGLRLLLPDAALLRVRLAERGSADFSELVADCSHTVEIVARFLALLELYREQVLSFEQEDPLGELVVRWVGGSVEQAREQAEAARARDEEEEYG